MKKAVQETLHGASLRAAAKAQGVSKSTLHHYKKKKAKESTGWLTSLFAFSILKYIFVSSPDIRKAPNYSIRRILTSNEEEELANYSGSKAPSWPKNKGLEAASI
jgi:hypothetical protein